MDYAGLKTNIEGWIHRTDLTAEIEIFITMAKSRIVHDLKSNKIEKRYSATLVSEYTDLPDDLISIRNVKIAGKIINYFTEDQIVQKGYDAATGDPAIYTIVGSEIRVIGAPTSADLEIVHTYSPEDMSADTDQDVILQFYPQLYIYAALIEYCGFTEDFDKSEIWAKYYADSIERINENALEVKYPSGQLSVRSI